ncbi:Cell division control protein 6-like protein B, partial [Bienertia sinuspersici]
SAIELLESEITENASNHTKLIVENKSSDEENVRATPVSQEIDIVQIHHMAVALLKTYRSPVVETIQFLPEHQQVILCTAVKLFRERKKESTGGELNRSYEALCNSSKLRPVGVMELSSMCIALNDQVIHFPISNLAICTLKTIIFTLMLLALKGLLKPVCSQKGEKLTLKVDTADITFALPVSFGNP